MSENKGFITLERTILKHWCSSNPNFLAVWVRLLGDANWETKKSLMNGSVVEIKRGQLIFGLNAFSDKSGVSVMKLRGIIKVLEDEGMINRQKTNKYSIISIVKYDYYQSINKPITSKQQSDNNQITTPKQSKPYKPKDNNIRAPKKDRKTKCPKDFNPNLDNAIKYWKEKGRLDLVPQAADIADAFLTDRSAKGVTYVNWADGWKTWYCNAVKFNKAPDKSRHMETASDWGEEETDKIKVQVTRYGKAIT